jgi:hypothetical protein
MIQQTTTREGSIAGRARVVRAEVRVPGPPCWRPACAERRELPSTGLTRVTSFDHAVEERDAK